MGWNRVETWSPRRISWTRQRFWKASCIFWMRVHSQASSTRRVTRRSGMMSGLKKTREKPTVTLRRPRR